MIVKSGSKTLADNLIGVDVVRLQRDRRGSLRWWCLIAVVLDCAGAPGFAAVRYRRPSHNEPRGSARLRVGLHISFNAYFADWLARSGRIGSRRRGTRPSWVARSSPNLLR